jgi:hypothetical protein
MARDGVDRGYRTAEATDGMVKLPSSVDALAYVRDPYPHSEQSHSAVRTAEDGCLGRVLDRRRFVGGQPRAAGGMMNDRLKKCYSTAAYSATDDKRVA